MTANIIDSVLNRPETGGEQTDTARFNALVTTEMKPLYRYARWLTGNAAVAEDLVQETLLRAWRAFGQLKESTSAKGWLLTILRRENARRFERKRLVESQLPVEAIPDDVPTYDTSTEAFALRRALEVLPESYREPLLMQVLFGFSQKEIAAQLGITVGGAGARLFRARTKMRELLEETPQELNRADAGSVETSGSRRRSTSTLGA